MLASERTALIHALQWHLDSGADEALSGTPIDATAMPSLPEIITTSPPPPAPPPTEGTPAAAREARKRAESATTREELRATIADFDGLAVKKTATQMIFAAGDPQAKIMLISDAPGTEDDREGIFFSGPPGQLLDKMLAAINLARTATANSSSIYMCPILNWRPPGNRTLQDGEIEITRPFITRHIELIAPQILILCGGITAKALLQTDASISRLRGKWHDFNTIPTLVTHHPATLLATPSHKKAAWADLLKIQEKARNLSIFPPAPL